MKKILLLLLIITSIYISFDVVVEAQTTTDEFYVAEEIDGLTYAKEKNGTISHRYARFKRRKSDNEIVYCIEPFVDLNENYKYKGYDANYEKLLNMSSSQWEEINLISYYGYGYTNHTSKKWYAITQILIWKAVDKNANFYFTDFFGGSKVTKFESEMQEIKDLVTKHKTKPSFNNKTYELTIQNEYRIADLNSVLNDYEVVDNDKVTIENNYLVYHTKEKEKLDIKLIKKAKKYKAYPIVYVNTSTQNILYVGKFKDVEAKVTLNVDCGTLKIKKVDSETKEIYPQGEGKLIGSIFGLYDTNNNLISEITIDDNSTGSLNNIKYGKYYIKEISSNNGYKVNENRYDININSSNKEIELEIENEIIKNKIRLKKYFGIDNNNKKVEKGIQFNIFNIKNEFVMDLYTDENGEVEFELPYGTYIVKQQTTTEGYNKVKDFKIVVDKEKTEVIEYYLNDLKIPDTDQNISLKHIVLTLISIIGIVGILFLYDEKIL